LSTATPAHDLIAIGASAGGVEALTRVVRRLPGDLPAAILVVLHLPASARSALPAILSRAGPLPAAEAVDGEPIQYGRIHVAAPNRHLLVEPGRIRTLAGPRENGARPAIDPLFRSAARAYRQRVAGVVLSGALDDGAAGLLTIKRCGGIAIVQHPDDALHPGMPLSAARLVEPDYSLPADEIGPMLAKLAATPANPVGEGALMAAEGDAQALGIPPVSKDEDRASGLTCPECHGSLWEVHDEQGRLLGYECRIEHRYSIASLLAEQARAVEAAVWAAINALEERAALLYKQGTRSRAAGHTTLAQRFGEQAHEAEQQAETIRRLLLEGILARRPAAE
jgi:two-component system chemotaxis response regulator CheB